ncbi:hypothetical protein [Psychroserpens sp. NJDZ02]|uniref:hypothetical protein n=1 Tax=Psychroserpens sp. NJDZ02 TaxID=2570561 RepID=UPI0010A8AC86|nr:hypothetical protein [Psychroserpens sp. NJDZ02]QCE42772.1 hypothetical protein E9099_15590 [Psychroserpens sp. NJDZ02]
MREYYNIELKFKDNNISKENFLAHLYISDEKMYFQIIDNNETSLIDRQFSMSKKSLGLFEDNFEIVNSEIPLLFDQSRIYKIRSFENDIQNKYFTIYVSKIALVFSNSHKERINEGKAYLSSNGLKIVNTFYSFFTNFKDKNEFSISRMNEMQNFYKAQQLTFRPELEFSNNEKRGSNEFTIKKIPTLNYKFINNDFHQVKKTIQIICNFISLCYGVKVIFESLTYRTEDKIFIYRDTSPNNKTFVSDFATIFTHLEKNYRIEKILKSNWYDNYIKEEKKFNKAIENYLHSREVDLSASFLLLFNIIEVFNIKQEIEKFEFNESKQIQFEKAFEEILISLKRKEDIELLRDKWNGIINKIELKPFKSPLEQTLILNNINTLDFGYSFNKLKKTRDKLTHGSVNSINEQSLKSQMYCLRNVSLRLILANLGFMNDLKNVT